LPSRPWHMAHLSLKMLCPFWASATPEVHHNQAPAANSPMIDQWMSFFMQAPPISHIIVSRLGMQILKSRGMTLQNVNLSIQ
jgi:hypothetical protein